VSVVSNSLAPGVRLGVYDADGNFQNNVRVVSSGPHRTVVKLADGERRTFKRGLDDPQWVDEDDNHLGIPPPVSSQ
jgi:hypothetical protein